MIVAVHLLLYTPEAAALRDALRDLLGGPHEAEGGEDWPIFRLPPAELGVHPSDGSTRHELSLVCDDIGATVSDLRARGFELRGEPSDLGFGVGLTLVLPGEVEVLVYEPRHETAFGGPGGPAG